MVRGVELVDLSQNRKQWQALAMVMNLQVT
jgi:hypothetical protein